MTTENPDSTEASDPKAEAERRSRRARVFGDVLPDSTSDDVADEAEQGSSDSDEWLRRQKPPHHG